MGGVAKILAVESAFRLVPAGTPRTPSSIVETMQKVTNKQVAKRSRLRIGFKYVRPKKFHMDSALAEAPPKTAPIWDGNNSTPTATTGHRA